MLCPYADRSNIQANAVTRLRMMPEQLAEVPPVTHPAVRFHDATERLTPFVNEASCRASLVCRMRKAAPSWRRSSRCRSISAVLYRQQWRAVDLVMWDNRTVTYIATECPPG
ncbi:hypothetical protein D9599_30385 [Roseomonas sp. KE2513]|nr:hypothetical protein [Roseomonas sp. KE2513]